MDPSIQKRPKLQPNLHFVELANVEHLFGFRSVYINNDGSVFGEMAVFGGKSFSFV